MNYRKWALILTPVVLIGGFILFASLSERAAESKAKAFCGKFKVGDDFSAALDLMRTTEASDKLVGKDNRLSIMFSSFDPQSEHFCDIQGKDGKIASLQYRYLNGE